MTIDRDEAKRLGGKTILAQIAEREETDDEKQNRERLDRDVDIARLIAVESVKAYQAGEITLLRLIDTVCKAAEKATHSEITDNARASWIGHAVLLAYRGPTPGKMSKGRKGAPLWHRRVAVAGIEWAKGKGAVASREPAGGKKSVFQAVAEYLSDLGVPTTAGQVEEWSGQHGDNQNKPND